jgi:putative aldouronate transport system substrate-binding protein
VALSASVPLLLSGCGLVPAPTRSTGTAGASSGSRTSPYPTYIPTNSPAKPDFHSTDPRYEDGFKNYPTPFKSWTKDPPGNGTVINSFVRIYYPPSVPRDQNPTYREMERQLNASVIMNQIPGTDYLVKFATLMAGSDLPDLMHIYQNIGIVPNLPEFLKAKCQDLTPYLSGDAIKDYPNLAAIPPYSWKNSISAIDGKLYLIPIHDLLPGGPPQAKFFRNTDIWDRVLGPTTLPHTADEFKRMLQQLNSPNVAAIENTANVSYGLKAVAQMFGVPNNWRLDAAGNLTKDYETDEFKAALAYLRGIFEAGLMSPRAVDTATNSRTDFVGGRMAVSAEGYGPSWNDFWRRGLQANPPQHFAMIPPFAHDGGKPTQWLGSGVIAMTALKKAPDERIKELLRVLDWMASPFGSEEELLFFYGLKDQDFTFDATGNPLPTTDGLSRSAYVPWRYISQHPLVAYQPDIPGYAQACNDAEQLIIPNGIEDPTQSFYSPTSSGPGVVANNTMVDGINQIIIGHEPLAAYDDLLRGWQAAAGNQLRKEYLTAMAASS